MLRLFRLSAVLACSLVFLSRAEAQNPTPVAGSEAAELLTLAKKIDEQNAKIDLLSQQILRLQRELERPHATSSEHIAPVALPVGSPIPANADTHVVARGETLTSIAKQHKVSVDQLQKLNHIENDRKLQIGQTLVIPGAPGSAASPSPSPSPNE
jgi:LysM repeat protein